MVIYEPKGRAQEYAYLAANLYQGCEHRCGYCYVPGVLRKSRQEWEGMQPRSRKNVIQQLRKDAVKYAGTRNRVLMCFMSDPYQPIAEKTGITRQAIQVLKEHDIPFMVLTKAGRAAMADFDLYGCDDWFGVTLVFWEGKDAAQWEPGAPGGMQRVNALEKAKQERIRTWVSLEPVFDPMQTLKLMAWSAPCVDLFKIGKLNHIPEIEAKIDWREFGWKAIQLCRKLGKAYYIKRDLAVHLHGLPIENTDNRRVQG